MTKNDAKHFPAFLAATVLLATLILFVFGMTALFPPVNAPLPSEEQEKLTSRLEKPTVVFGNPTRGPNDARVTIVIFGDYLCGPCAEMEASLNQLLTEYPKDVRVVWKDFPNAQLHPGATDAAIAARCAFYQGAFWEYHDLLFTSSQGVVASNYPIFAGQLGLDTAAFSTCLTETPPRALVERDTEEGLRLGIDATPYLFINSRRVSGAVSYDTLKQFTQAELNQAAATAPQPAAEPTPPANR
ncbi:MAG: thioredoxin domain-containing protein [Patescibacteria group bacterium]|nr:thioredoxin domain-containing protein [Patescibacteria group bacterium]